MNTPTKEELPTKPKDKYDLAIEYLTEHPEEIVQAWYEGGYTDHRRTPQSCLFLITDESQNECGCLVQIKGQVRGSSEGPTPELTKLIQADKRIPKHPRDITVADLPVFAEWQRRLDKELGRTV